MIIIGHRGAKGLAPENTAASFQKALDLGVNAIEYDLRTTKDKRCVVMHDSTVTDASGQKPTIASLTYDELLAIKPDAMTYEQAIELVDRRCLLWTEVKPGADIEPIIATTKTYLAKGWQAGDFLFVSFDQAILRRLHQELPDIRLAINESFWSWKAIRRANEVGTKTIIMSQKYLWSLFIKVMNRRGYELGTYTLNDPVKGRRWQAYGLAAICTDYPDRFLNDKQQ